MVSCATVYVPGKVLLMLFARALAILRAAGVMSLLLGRPKERRAYDETTVFALRASRVGRPEE